VSSVRSGVRLQIVLLSVGLGSSLSSLALEPASLQLGPFYAAPTLNLETRYTDNLFRSEDDEKSTWILDTTPEVQTWLQNGNSTYSVSMQLQDFRYDSSMDDDFTDYRGNLDLHHEFNARNTLDVVGEWYDGHEERGTGLSDGNIADRIDKPVELETVDFGVRYTLGNQDTVARVEAGYLYYDREYQNYRTETQFRDYDQDRLDVAFYYTLAPRTDLLAEIRYIENRYDVVNLDDPDGSYDSDEYNYYVGFAWDTSAKTSGTLKLGWFDREYRSVARETNDGFSWEVDVFYKPRNYSEVNLESRRYSQETNGVGDAVDTQEYTVRWDHDWSNRASTHFEIVKGEYRYTNSDRTDDRWFSEVKYSYKFRRWFDISGGYRYEDRESSSSRSIDYSRNVCFIAVDLSL
jgi:hypothetical protein